MKNKFKPDDKLNSNNNVNHNIELLFKLNISEKDSLKVFHDSTRDRNGLNVLKCAKSDVIVLAKNLLAETYYVNNTYYNFDNDIDTVRGIIKSKPLDDDIRRFESYKELIKGSEILDFGCGKGGFLQLSKAISKKSIGLEINDINRKYIKKTGLTCIKSLSELNDDKFDLITLNHVFEHLNDPINILVELQKYLKDNGIIIIEVPNARDLLLTTFNLESYKNFIFWSDHLILHTRDSLEKFAIHSGLYLKNIKGIQRYPISNHFNWLLNGQPSGHEIFHHLNNEDFHKQYEKLLNMNDQTDTLIGYFSKNI